MVRGRTADFGAAKNEVVLSASSAFVLRIAPRAFIEVVKQTQVRVRLADPFGEDPEYFRGSKRSRPDGYVVNLADAALKRGCRRNCAPQPHERDEGSVGGAEAVQWGFE
jgi:hypothetical protein